MPSASSPILTPPGDSLFSLLLFLSISPVQFACKAAVVFCHYCVMTNFFWLLVEALYLNSLLLSSFYHSRRCLWGFGLLGWGEKSSMCVFEVSCIDLQAQLGSFITAVELNAFLAQLKIFRKVVFYNLMNRTHIK